MESSKPSITKSVGLRVVDAPPRSPWTSGNRRTLNSPLLQPRQAEKETPLAELFTTLVLEQEVRLPSLETRSTPLC